MANTNLIKKDNDFVLIDNKIYFNPYNSKNIEIVNNDIVSILNKYGVSMELFNFELYRRAFIHDSYTKSHLNENDNILIADKPPNCLPIYTRSNQGLEFLGDGVIELITKHYLYKRFAQTYDEGFMSDIKIKLVNNKNIGRIAREIGLNKWYIMSKNKEQNNVRYNDEMLGCLFEAFVGALYLDFSHITVNDEHNWFSNVFISGPGFQVAQIFMEHIFDTHIDWTSLIIKTENYNRPLQELLQCEFKKVPEIIEISPHSKINGYHIGVYLYINNIDTNMTMNNNTMNNNTMNNNTMNNNIVTSTFTSFENVHKHLALHHTVKIKLGEGLDKKKANAKQIACLNAITYLKTKYTDFNDVFLKIQNKFQSNIDISNISST